MNRRAFNRLLGTAAVGLHLESPAQSQSQNPPAGKVPRFSCMLWTLEKQASLLRALEIVAAAGYAGVELVGEFQHWSVEERARVLAKLRSLGLVVDAMSGVRAGFAVPQDAELFGTQFAAQVEAARALACPGIILLSGPRVEGSSHDAQRKVAIDNLQRAGDLAAAHGIEVLIEPIDSLEDPTVFLTSVREGFEIVREVNRPNVKVLYDLYHEQRGAGNLIEKLEGNIHLVGLIHIADVPGRHEPGTGEIDYPNIYKALARLHYDCFIAMEFYPIGDATDALRRCKGEVLQAYAAMS